MGVAAGCPELFRVGVVALASLVEASALAGLGGWSWLVLPGTSRVARWCVVGGLFCFAVWWGGGVWRVAVGWWGWLGSTLLGF